MTKRHATLALTLAAALELQAAALGGTAAGAPARSGLTGIVMRGPITPVCRVDVPCDAPAAAFVLVFARAGTVRPLRATTDARGRYRVALPAGTYTVSGAVPAGVGRGISPARVHVRAGHVDRIDFSVDTGIR
jgi:hypothetical protein